MNKILYRTFICHEGTEYENLYAEVVSKEYYDKNDCLLDDREECCL